jgi:hypothetical protein
VPDWTSPEVREHWITAVYRGGDAAISVPLPTSNPQVQILELAIESERAQQTFSARQRHLLLPAGVPDVRVQCRFRVFRDHDDDRRAWPTAESLFPGADRIEFH